MLHDFLICNCESTIFDISKIEKKLIHGTSHIHKLKTNKYPSSLRKDQKIKCVV